MLFEYTDLEDIKHCPAAALYSTLMFCDKIGKRYKKGRTHWWYSVHR